MDARTRLVRLLARRIVRMGGSAALEARLRELERERAAPDAPAAADMASVAGNVAEALAEYRRQVMDLATALGPGADLDEARPLLAEMLGAVTIENRGAEVWAQLEQRTVSRIAVAGARNVDSRQFVRTPPRWVRIS